MLPRLTGLRPSPRLTSYGWRMKTAAPEIVEEYSRYRRLLDSELTSLQDLISRNGGLGELISSARAAQLAGRVVRALRTGAPLSVCRFHDGEGSLVFARQHGHEFPHIATLLTNRILRLMFGRNEITAVGAEEMSRSVIQAFDDADVVGVPTPRWLSTGIPDDAEVLRNASTLAAVAANASVLELLAHRERDSADVIAIGIHRGLLPHYTELIQSADRITVVTSLGELPGFMAETFGVRTPRVILIPGQAANLRSTPPPHWPDAYVGVLEALASEDRSGELVLVAAGILGKEYTTSAARAGAVAVDVGSIVEAWIGESVRPYHSAGFLAEVAAVLHARPRAVKPAADALLDDTPLGPEFASLVERIRPGISIEIGAHAAEFSQVIAARYPEMSVIACEANPDVVREYAATATAAGVDYRHVAVADTEGDVQLHVPREISGGPDSQRELPPTHRISSLLPLVAGWRAREELVLVPAVTLDALIAESATSMDRVVLWIDVEGATGIVLSGVTQEGLDRVDAILVELERSPSWVGQWSDTDVIEFLASRGLSLAMQADTNRRQYNAIFVRETQPLGIE